VSAAVVRALRREHHPMHVLYPPQSPPPVPRATISAADACRQAVTIRRTNAAFERAPADAATRLRVVLLRSDDPHQRWLERELARTSAATSHRSLLHLVSSELDGGDLVAVHRPTIHPHDHDEHLYCRSLHGAGLLLCERLSAPQRGTQLQCTPQGGPDETFRHRDRTPPRELRLWLRRRLGAHRVPHLNATPYPVLHSNQPQLSSTPSST
jgi:hypothetical protein